MKFKPNSWKFDKVHIPRRRFKKTVNDKIIIGDYALVAVQSGLIDEKQLEIIRLLFIRLVRKIKTGEFLIRVFAHVPYHKRAPGVRMGKGVSPLEKWVAIINTGKIICEVKNISLKEVNKIFRQIRIISGVKLKMISKINNVK